jgi:hypothetical protein
MPIDSSSKSCFGTTDVPLIVSTMYYLVADMVFLRKNQSWYFKKCTSVPFDIIVSFVSEYFLIFFFCGLFIIELHAVSNELVIRSVYGERSFFSFFFCMACTHGMRC